MRHVFTYGAVFVAMMLLLGLLRWMTGYSEDGNLLVNSVAAGFLTAITMTIYKLVRKFMSKK